MEVCGELGHKDYLANMEPSLRNEAATRLPSRAYESMWRLGCQAESMRERRQRATEREEGLLGCRAECMREKTENNRKRRRATKVARPNAWERRQRATEEKKGH